MKKLGSVPNFRPEISIMSPEYSCSGAAVLFAFSFDSPPGFALV